MKKIAGRALSGIFSLLLAGCFYGTQTDQNNGNDAQVQALSETPARYNELQNGFESMKYSFLAGDTVLIKNMTEDNQYIYFSYLQDTVKEILNSAPGSGCTPDFVQNCSSAFPGANENFVFSQENVFYSRENLDANGQDTITIFQADLDGTNRKELMSFTNPMGGERITYGLTSHMGKLYYYHYYDRSMYEMDPGTGKNRVVFTFPEETEATNFFFHDGIVFAGVDQYDNQITPILKIDLADGSVEVMVPNKKCLYADPERYLYVNNSCVYLSDWQGNEQQLLDHPALVLIDDDHILLSGNTEDYRVTLNLYGIDGHQIDERVVDTLYFPGVMKDGKIYFEDRIIPFDEEGLKEEQFLEQPA